MGAKLDNGERERDSKREHIAQQSYRALFNEISASGGVLTPRYDFL